MYAASFDSKMLSSVAQWLEVFEGDPELLDQIRIEIESRRQNEHDAVQKMMKAQEAASKRYKQKELMEEEDGFPGEPRHLPIMGLCPKCNAPMGGMFMAGWETEKSGRLFYRECSSCSYYAELYKKRRKYKEVEGG
jgi:hypothetical protein